MLTNWVIFLSSFRRFKLIFWSFKRVSGLLISSGEIVIASFKWIFPITFSKASIELKVINSWPFLRHFTSTVIIKRVDWFRDLSWKLRIFKWILYFRLWTVLWLVSWLIVYLAKASSSLILILVLFRCFTFPKVRISLIKGVSVRPT